MNATERTNKTSHMISVTGSLLIRYGLVVVLAWIGGMKFTAYEAAAIQPLVANSPLLGWTYSLFDVQTVSSLIGIAEISIALLIAIYPLSARISAIGSALAIPMFITTLSFMLSTPPTWEATAGGFPALSVVPGQFLLKDIVLLGAALWTLSESMAASRQTA